MRKVLLAGVAALLLATETAQAQVSDNYVPIPRPFVARYLKAAGDPRKVVRDPEARYFGGRVEEHSLVPLGEARLGRQVNRAFPPSGKPAP